MIKDEWNMRPRPATKTSGIFEALGDVWRLVHDHGRPRVEWLEGEHFLEGKLREVNYRKNPRGKQIYLQFTRPRLAGEKYPRLICIPAETMREVYENE